MRRFFGGRLGSYLLPVGLLVATWIIITLTTPTFRGEDVPAAIALGRRGIAWDVEHELAGPVDLVSEQRRRRRD